MSVRPVGWTPPLAQVALVALCTALGVWQVERLHWKRALLAHLDAAERAPPIPLATAAAPPTQFRRVVVSGTLDPRFAAAYASDVRDVDGVPTFGVFLLEPIRRPGALPLLVDLGWIPASTAGRPVRVVAGPHRVLGYVRRPETPRWLTPADDPAHRQFYALDPASIAAAIGLGPVAPFTVVALAPVEAAAFPQPAPSLPRPPNNHLQYAVTWFTLAAIALVMSAIWWWQRRRTVMPPIDGVHARGNPPHPGGPPR